LTSIAQNIASQIQFTTFMLEDESTYFAPDWSANSPESVLYLFFLLKQKFSNKTFYYVYLQPPLLVSLFSVVLATEKRV
jgi:hypothetical protein